MEAKLGFNDLPLSPISANLPLPKKHGNPLSVKLRGNKVGLLQKDRTAALKAPRLQAAEIGRVATAPIEDSHIPGAVATLCLSVILGWTGRGDRRGAEAPTSGATVAASR